MRDVIRGKRILLQQRAVGGIKRPSAVDGFVSLGPHVHGLVTGRRGNDGTLVAIDVVQLGPSSLFRLAHTNRFAGEQLRDLSVASVKISGNDGVLGAYDHTGRLEPDFGAMSAEVAFGRGTVVRIDVNGIVGAGLHARFAAYTAFRAEIDDAVFALIHRCHGADRDAGWVFAMIAARDLKNAAGVGKGSLLDVLNPGAIDR